MTTAPLVNAGQYATWTGDSVTDPNSVTDALADALAELDEHCQRRFAYGTWRETLYIYPDGKVYPSATPLVAVTDPPGQWSIQGVGVWIGWWDPFPILANTSALQQGGYPPQTTITYTGGYQPCRVTDGPTPPLPTKLGQIVAQMAWNSLHPVQLPSIPAGANSAHVGDVGYSGPKALANAGDMITDSIAAALEGYVRRQVRGWQANAVPA